MYLTLVFPILYSLSKLQLLKVWGGFRGWKVCVPSAKGYYSVEDNRVTFPLDRRMTGQPVWRKPIVWETNCHSEVDFQSDQLQFSNLLPFRF